MKPNFYWIEGPWKGRLAIFARPRGGDWLEDEVRFWKKAGLDTVVSALVPEETQELELSNEAALCKIHGINFISFPVEDREVPLSMSRTRELAETLDNALDAGKSVGIHCRQGIGRSSLLAACVLLLENVEPAKAFESICQARGGPVPDTLEQKEWVSRFAKEQSKIVGKAS